MKNILLITLAVIGLAVAAVAAEPFRWVFLNQGETETFDSHSKPITVRSIKAFYGSAATSKVTIVKVHGLVTNDAFATITLASASGDQTNMTTYLFPGDQLSPVWLGGATQAIFEIEGTTP
jgi:hypothetical protein